jgi:hypothetical protein
MGLSDELDEEELSAPASWEDGDVVRSIAACYRAALRALELVRAYRREPGSTGRREAECLAEVARLRREILTLRIASSGSERVRLPGVLKANPSSSRLPPNAVSTRRSG